MYDRTSILRLLILIQAGMRKGLEGHIPGDYRVVPIIDESDSGTAPLDETTSGSSQQELNMFSA